MVPPRWPDEAGPPHPYLPLPALWPRGGDSVQGIPRGASPARRLATFPTRNLRGLVRARAGSHPDAAARRTRHVRAGAGGMDRGDCAFNTSDLLAPVHTLREAETEPLNIEWTRVHNGGTS